MRKIVLLVMLGASCGKPPPPPPELPFPALGAFDYKERMKLPEEVLRWKGKLVRATGFINPMRQSRDLTEFYLVKDRSSCCFGKAPQMNHYIAVKLRPGLAANYSTDPVAVQGVLQVEERWDGDWPTGLYFMDGAEVVK